MKKINFLLLGLAILFAACGDDRSAENALRYDGDNQTAPLLEEDAYEAAARFPSSITSNYIGQNLTQVSFYMAGTPLQSSVVIYEGGTADEPGTEVYSESITGTITQNAFNAHVLSTPVPITGDDLWISIKFRQNRTLQTIGCDAGPNSGDGDWLYRESDGRWLTFNQRTGEGINWNIRGVVSE